jgi:hypothetical protein
MKKPDGVGWGRVPRAPRRRARAGSAAVGEGRSGGRAARVGGGGEGGRGFGLGVRRASDRGCACTTRRLRFIFARCFTKATWLYFLSFLAVGLGILRAPQPRSTPLVP